MDRQTEGLFGLLAGAAISGIQEWVLVVRHIMGVLQQHQGISVMGVVIKMNWVYHSFFLFQHYHELCLSLYYNMTSACSKKGK